MAKPNVPLNIALSVVNILAGMLADPVPLMPPRWTGPAMRFRLLTLTVNRRLCSALPRRSTPTVTSEPLASKVKVPLASDWPLAMVSEPVAPIVMLLSPLPEVLSPGKRQRGSAKHGQAADASQGLKLLGLEIDAGEFPLTCSTSATRWRR